MTIFGKPSLVATQTFSLPVAPIVNPFDTEVEMIDTTTEVVEVVDIIMIDAIVDTIEEIRKQIVPVDSIINTTREQFTVVAGLVRRTSKGLSRRAFPQFRVHPWKGHIKKIRVPRIRVSRAYDKQDLKKQTKSNAIKQAQECQNAEEVRWKKTAGWSSKRSAPAEFEAVSDEDFFVRASRKGVAWIPEETNVHKRWQKVKVAHKKSLTEAYRSRLYKTTLRQSEYFQAMMAKMPENIADVIAVLSNEAQTRYEMKLRASYIESCMDVSTEDVTTPGQMGCSEQNLAVIPLSQGHEGMQLDAELSSNCSQMDSITTTETFMPQWMTAPPATDMPQVMDGVVTHAPVHLLSNSVQESQQLSLQVPHPPVTAVDSVSINPRASSGHGAAGQQSATSPLGSAIMNKSDSSAGTEMFALQPSNTVKKVPGSDAIAHSAIKTYIQDPEQSNETTAGQHKPETSLKAPVQSRSRPIPPPSGARVARPFTLSYNGHEVSSSRENSDPPPSGACDAQSTAHSIIIERNAPVAEPAVAKSIRGPVPPPSGARVAKPMGCSITIERGTPAEETAMKTLRSNHGVPKDVVAAEHDCAKASSSTRCGPVPPPAGACQVRPVSIQPANIDAIAMPQMLSSPSAPAQECRTQEIEMADIDDRSPQSSFESSCNSFNRSRSSAPSSVFSIGSSPSTSSQSSTHSSNPNPGCKEIEMIDSGLIEQARPEKFLNSLFLEWFHNLQINEDAEGFESEVMDIEVVASFVRNDLDARTPVAADMNADDVNAPAPASTMCATSLRLPNTDMDVEQSLVIPDLDSHPMDGIAKAVPGSTTTATRAISVDQAFQSIGPTAVLENSSSKEMGERKAVNALQRSQSIEAQTLAPQAMTSSDVASIEHKQLVTGAAPSSAVENSYNYMKTASLAQKRKAVDSAEDEMPAADLNPTVPKASARKKGCHKVTAGKSTWLTTSSKIASQEQQASTRSLRNSPLVSDRASAAFDSRLRAESSFKPKSWKRGSINPPASRRRYSAPAKAAFEVADPYPATMTFDDRSGGQHWDLLRELRAVVPPQFSDDDDEDGIRKFFILLMNQCRWIDDTAKFSNRWICGPGADAVTAQNLSELADYQPGACIEEILPWKPLPHEEPNDVQQFRKDLCSLVDLKPRLWEYLLGGLLQMNVDLTSLLGGENRVHEVSASRNCWLKDISDKFIIDYRRVDDVDAQRSNDWSGVYREYYHLNELGEEDRQDYCALVPMILEKGYSGVFSSFLADWIEDDEEHHQKFRSILEKAGWVSWDDEDDYMALEDQLYKMLVIDKVGISDPDMAADLVKRCIKWRYPRWFHCRDWPTDRENAWLARNAEMEEFLK